MKIIALALLAILALAAQLRAQTLDAVSGTATQVQTAINSNAPAQAPYACHTAACFVWNDWAHAQVSAQLLYAPARKMVFDGGSADLAVIYNPAILSSKWPKAFTSAGVPPPACAFLELGGGGDKQSGFVHVGASCNVAPVLVGYAVKGLTAAGGTYAGIGALILSPDGSGVKLSVGDKADVVANGGVEKLASIKGEVVVGVGYTYKFK